MSLTLQVQDVDVLFGRNGAAPDAAGAAIIVPRPLDEPPGFRVGLVDVNLTVHAGDCLAVLGASGHGKSSLLRTIAGLQPMRRGRIVVDGRDVTALPPEQRGVVYLHQEPVLFPHLDVLGNVAFPLVLRGASRRDAQRRAFTWLEQLQVAGVAANRSDALSGGQRHRVALARALCADPAVLLLDEPLASLDPAVRRDVRAALLDARAASGAAMVLVTHDLDDALTVATHMSLIDWMTLTPAATPALLLHAPPSLPAARLLGVFSEIAGAVIDTRDGRVFRWIGGDVPVGDVATGPAMACARAAEVCVRPGDPHDAAALVIGARRDGAHDVALTLRSAGGESVTVRTGRAASLAVGDTVLVTLDAIRVFHDQGRSHV